MSDKETPGAESAAPGFTFADKRKITPDGEVKKPSTDVEEAGFVDGASAVGTADEAAEVSGSNEFQQLAAERLADLQRLQAEYANYRKRVERDRDVSREYGVWSVVEALLPVLDDLHLARQHGDLESGPFAAVADKIETTLSKFGVERFGEPGVPFDPTVHDALMHVEEELAEGTDVTTVVGVLQPGYMLGEKVLRPARVSVADPQ